MAPPKAGATGSKGQAAKAAKALKKGAAAMAGVQAKIESMQVRADTNVYVNTWHTTLLQATKKDCPYCCFSVFCPYCVSYLLRKRTLYDDMTRYTCCGGFMPCSGKCKEQSCPEFCLCLEVVCCFASSVASTRFLLQDEFRIQTTKCDNCIISTMFFLQYLACLCQLAACILGSQELQELANCISWISDLVYCSVCACMQTQHKVELDKRDGKFAAQGVQPLQAPQQQEMNRYQTGPPGYPQGGPPGYGGPPPGYGGGPPGYGGGPSGYGGPPPGYGDGAPPGYPSQGGPPGGYTTAPPPQAMQYGAPPPGYPQAQQFTGAPAYQGAPYK